MALDENSIPPKTQQPLGFSLEALALQLPLRKIGTGYVVAYSGGLDSHVLLHSLVQLKVTPLRAIHINHQLHPQSHAWMTQCQNICNHLNVPLQCITIDIQPNAIHQSKETKQNLEARARTQRYQVLFNQLGSNEQLLTAHHKNDQAETVLLQLFRGAGIKGLAGIRQTKKRFRPLLSFSRDELECYARAHQLQWIEDTSNRNEHFSRNYLRHTIIPQLEKRWPGLSTTLSRTAKRCAETDTLLSELAAIDLQTPLNSPSRPKQEDPDNLTSNACVFTLPLEKLRPLSSLRQKNVLRYWLASQGLPLPSDKKMQHIVTDVIQCHRQACPLISWSTTEIKVEIRRHQDTLYLKITPNLLKSARPPKTPDSSSSLPSTIPLTELSLPWDFKTPLDLPAEAGGGQLVASPSSQPIPDTNTYTVRFRRGGERCYLPGRSHSQSLKKLMQAWHIPPWKRDKVPLLYRNNQLVAVIGYTVCQDFDLNIQVRLVHERNDR